MTWIRIDRESTENAMTRVVAVAQRAVPLLDSMPALADAGGLGDLGPSTADLVSASHSVLDEAYRTYLTESIGVLEKLLALVREQQAASVVGAVGSPVGGFGSAVPLVGGMSPADAIIGATLVGGSSSWSPAGAVSVSLGPSIVGGGSSWSPDYIGGGGTMTIGAPSYANDPLMRAAIAAQERGDTSMASQLLGVQSSISDANSFSNTLWSAPAGARAMGPYGASSGYEPFGSTGIEVPIRYSS